MLPKSRRLSRKDFLVAKSQGQTHRTPHFSAVYVAGSGHFSVVTSKKLHKHAVIRNRLRRQIYDQLKAISYKLEADIIIFPHKSMLNLSGEELRSELHSFLSKIS